MEVIYWPAGPEAWSTRAGHLRRQRTGSDPIYGNVVVYCAPEGWVESLPPMAERGDVEVLGTYLKPLGRLDDGDLGWTIKTSLKRLEAWVENRLSHFSRHDTSGLVAIVFYYPF